MSHLDSVNRWNKKNPSRAHEISCIAYYKNRQKQRNKAIEIKNERGTTCEIIKKHYEDMKDDPERLTTEFIKSIVNIKCDD